MIDEDALLLKVGGFCFSLAAGSFIFLFISQYLTILKIIAFPVAMTMFFEGYIGAVCFGFFALIKLYNFTFGRIRK